WRRQPKLLRQGDFGFTRAVSLHSIKFELKREHRPGWLRHQRRTSAYPPSTIQPFDGTSTYSELGRYRPSTPTRFKQRYRGLALLLGQRTSFMHKTAPRKSELIPQSNFRGAVQPGPGLFCLRILISKRDAATLKQSPASQATAAGNPTRSCGWAGHRAAAAAPTACTGLPGSRTPSSPPSTWRRRHAAGSSAAARRFQR
ncbi:MAG: hypothetical protein JWQ56_4035, partial [Pseudarthrobacter sp.]|nr:hypothetical protein [Pseudarthrobacter sp.]